MNRHRIDTSTSYSSIISESLPPWREIEVAEVDEIDRRNPLKAAITCEPYRPDSALAKAVDLAIALGRPLLLQGEPGCGKTRLAYALAYALQLPLEKCYIKSTSRAQDLLYTYDAVKRLYDVQLGKRGLMGVNRNPHFTDASNYIHFGPLGRAIVRASCGRRSVVLIDEIDKADLDFPNDLLWELDRLEFRVAETSQVYEVGDYPEIRPIVIITNNEEKPLPAAFLRRCIFHYLNFPHSEAELKEIIALHNINAEVLSEKAISVLMKLRDPKLNLSKKPGLSELLDWVGFLDAKKIPINELDKLPYSEALLKQQSDLQRAREVFKE